MNQKKDPDSANFSSSNESESKEPINSSSEHRQEGSSSPDEHSQIERQLHEFEKFSKRVFRRIVNLFKQGKWLELLLYSVGLLVILFTPGAGVLYNFLIKEIVEDNTFITPILYTTAFLSILFFIFLTCLLLSMLSQIKRSKKSTKIILSALIIACLVLWSSRFSFYQIGYIPGEFEDRYSLGEESLFDRKSPEARVFENNRRALDASRNLFNKPYKVAVTIPISWSNGFENAREVLLGVALAQQEWNDKHQNNQMMVLLADDGYDTPNDTNDDPEEELKVADEVANKLTSNKEILGVIGHFTSDATGEHVIR